MNESIFTNYDNYFCSTNQVSIDNSLLQNMDFDMPPTTLHNYMTNVSCDLPLSSTSAEQRLGQNSCFPFLAQRREEHEKHKDAVTNLCVTTSSAVVPSSGSGIFANIPFVQIHTTDVQPQRTSYGNVFRRNISKQEEIKSEPIKSESAEASKDRTNATPTPPRAPSSTQTPAGGVLRSSDESSQHNVQCENVDLSAVVKGNNCQIYKCSKCPFLALKEDERNNHESVQHDSKSEQDIVERPQINCPGCDNVFFYVQSLDTHLRLDHFMSQDDATKLLISSVVLNSKENESKPEDNSSKSTTLINENASKEPLRKSRIYLKNVDCLREPNRQPFEQTENQLTEQNNNTISQGTKAPLTKQKISIKSVDVLREPALLRRDYELDQGSYNFITDNNNLNDQLSISTPTTYEYGQNSDSLVANTCSMNNNLNMDNSSVNNPTDPVEKPRRPKIYVKSVESFNLMPQESIRSNDFLDDPNNMCNVTSTQAYDANVGHLPFMYDANAVPSNMTNNTNYISNHNDMDSTYQYSNNTSQMNNNYIMENSLYTYVHVVDLEINSEQLENVTLVADETPPPQNLANNGEDNITMNKSPHPTHEQRGTLHLRTVDELNLMNKNEVQHLIAPQLDNNHGGELTPKDDQPLDINNVVFISDTLYETESFKFQDLDTQMVNGWPVTYEDLEGDINGILTEGTTENAHREVSVLTADNNTQKNTYNNLEIDTPQVSMITIRDIEELTGVANATTMSPIIHNETNHEVEPIIEQMSRATNEQTENVCIIQNISLNKTTPRIETSENLKREPRNATPETNESPALSTNFNGIESGGPTIVHNTQSTAKLPKLTLISSQKLSTPNTTDTAENSGQPLPKMPRLIKINKTPPTSSPVEKGRIYVANNLMEPTKRPVAVAATCGTSVRGRPYGSNRTRITQLKQVHGNVAEEFFVKCALKGCAFRFKKAETMDYHKKCHDTTSTNLQATICPECKSTEFSNWNTLHTHLWRAHQIDMELYKCELCDFKTPVFSRLINTHAKIHFDDRNYKCEQCGKGFKNSKQLKNHRRWHRVQMAKTGPPQERTPQETKTETHQCTECGSTFYQKKSLREHCCKKSDTSLSTKASSKPNMATHSEVEKRYKCQQCDYTTNDHNAFRRHRMTHENKKMYQCQFCEYKSIQSVAYQKHVQRKHPNKADSVIHKCNECTFSTINRSLLLCHQGKHKPINGGGSDVTNSNGHDENVAITKPKTDVQQSKIKVKSNLFTTRD